MFGIEDFTKSIVDFSNFEFSQLGEAAAFGGAILFMGMLAVFSVLCILWLCLTLFKFFFHDLASRKVKKEKSKVIEATPIIHAVQQNSDMEIIAVIAAAIAMAESETKGKKFRVVSFKRK